MLRIGRTADEQDPGRIVAQPQLSENYLLKQITIVGRTTTETTQDPAEPRDAWKPASLPASRLSLGFITAIHQST